MNNKEKQAMAKLLNVMCMFAVKNRYENAIIAEIWDIREGFGISKTDMTDAIVELMYPAKEEETP